MRADFGDFWCFWVQAEDQNLGQVRAAGATPARLHHRRRPSAVPEGSDPKTQGQAHQDSQRGEKKVIFPSFPLTLPDPTPKSGFNSHPKPRLPFPW